MHRHHRGRTQKTAHLHRVAHALAGARVLLVDDLFTTGSTASECARTLLAAGASDVTCVTLARTPPKEKSPSV